MYEDQAARRRRGYRLKSAEVLAEVGKALIDLHYIKNDALDAIVWGVKTEYARTLWDTPGDPVKDCSKPKSSRRV